jgi:hypothetical protein
METATQTKKSNDYYCSKGNISFCILMGAMAVAGLWLFSGLLVAFFV